MMLLSHHLLKKLILLESLLLLGLNIHAQQKQYFIGQNTDTFYIKVAPQFSLDLSEKAYVLADKTLSIDFEKARSSAFILLDSFPWAGRFQRGRYAYWVFFCVANQTNDTLKLTLHCGNKDSLFLYTLNAPERKPQLAGRFIPVQRNLKTFSPGKLYFSLELPPQSVHAFLVRIRNVPGFTLDIKPHLYNPLHQTSELQDSTAIFFKIHYFFLGILIFAFSYALLQYTQVRDLAFLFFSLYTLSIGVFYFREFQLANPFADLNPSWFYRHIAYAPTSWLIYIFHLLFVDAFLQARYTLPRLHQYIRYSIYIFLFITLGGIFVHLYIDIWWGWELFQVVRILFLFACLYPLFLIWQKKERLYTFVLLGEGVLIIGVIITMLLSFLPVHLTKNYVDVPNLPSHVGIAFQMVCFLLGLGYKSRSIEKAKVFFEAQWQHEQTEAKHLQDLDHFKSQFYTNITHEFRTPLTIINGMTDFIETDPERYLKEGILKIRNSSRRVLHLVNQLLDLSKLESGSMPLNLTYGDCYAHLRYLLEANHSLADKKGIKIHFSQDQTHYFAQYDADKLESIVSNLLSNSLKFSSSGTEVSLSVRAIEQSILCICVKDEGIGIPEAAIPYIFDRFYQVRHINPLHAESGTGVGLALTKELVKLLEGEIQVYSAPNQGSTFEVKLPIAQIPKLPINLSVLSADNLQSKADEWIVLNDVPLQTISASSSSAKLLLIEDNPEVVRYLSLCLQDQYELMVAFDGESGLQQAFEVIPDLIISDVMMPGKDGYEICSALKIHPHTSHIPIILLTAKADHDSRLKGLAKGADAYLIKPFHRGELLLRVQKLLELRRILQVYYRTLLTSPSAVEPVFFVNEQDREFLQRFKCIAEAHLDDPCFRVEQFGPLLGMSREGLRRKLIAITGESARPFFEKLRMNRACQLLSTSNVAISQIAYACGYDDPEYFTVVFKQHYNETPSIWRSKNKI